jgi:hypothetical protein
VWYRIDGSESVQDISQKTGGKGKKRLTESPQDESSPPSEGFGEGKMKNAQENTHQKSSHFLVTNKKVI